MMEVIVRDGNISRAINELNRKVSGDGTLRAFRERAKGYLKRSAAIAAKRRRAARKRKSSKSFRKFSGTFPEASGRGAATRSVYERVKVLNEATS